MYEAGRGMGPVAAGVAGITMLPNTGAGEIFVVLSYVSTVVGMVILASTAARLIARRVYSV